MTIIYEAPRRGVASSVTASSLARATARKLGDHRRVLATPARGRGDRGVSVSVVI